MAYPGRIGFCCDIWSLGTTALHMMYGEYISAVEKEEGTKDTYSSISDNFAEIIAEHMVKIGNFDKGKIVQQYRPIKAETIKTWVVTSRSKRLSHIMLGSYLPNVGNHKKEELQLRFKGKWYPCVLLDVEDHPEDPDEDEYIFEVMIDGIKYKGRRTQEHFRIPMPLEASHAWEFIATCLQQDPEIRTIENVKALVSTWGTE